MSEISALGNVNNVKISVFLAFVVMLFFLCCSYLKIACGGGVHLVQDNENLYEREWRFFYNNFKKSLALLFNLPLCQTILEQLLSYEVTLAKKCKNTGSEQVK